MLAESSPVKSSLFGLKSFEVTSPLVFRNEDQQKKLREMEPTLTELLSTAPDYNLIAKDEVFTSRGHPRLLYIY